MDIFVKIYRVISPLPKGLFCAKIVILYLVR